LIDFARLGKLLCFRFEATLNGVFFLQALFCGVTADIFSNPHAAKMRAAHGTEVRSFGAFLRKSLTKLMPIIFALGGLAVNSSLCRLIPVGSMHHGLE
jgi:hypothetical protein